MTFGGALITILAIILAVILFITFRVFVGILLGIFGALLIICVRTVTYVWLSIRYPNEMREWRKQNRE